MATILGAIVALPLVISPRMTAQTASPPSAGSVTESGQQAEAERVIVTGSNIPTAQEVGPNPVFNIDRETINKSGQGTTAEELLKIQPVMNANGVPLNNNANAGGGPSGTASVSLRGFDPGATLVLIDGRRVTPFPGFANSGAGFIDLLSIPIAAVQSIEILKDGASTTYGADAVAGVVNLKLYKEYRGAQLTLNYGDTLDKDAGLYSGDLLFGTGNDKAGVVGDIFSYHHNSMLNRDRGNSLVGPARSANTSPWNLQINSLVAEAAGGINVFGDNISKNEFTTPPNGTNGLAPPSAYIYDTRRVRRDGGLLPGFNFNLFSSSLPEQERWGAYAAFNDKICDDRLQLYGDFYYAHVTTHDELAPQATGDFETPGSFTIFVPPHTAFTNDIPGAPGGPPLHTPTAGQVGAPQGAFNPFNPFEQIISGGTRARIADFGNRVFINENETWLSTIGVKGDKLFDGSWGYDGAFRYSEVLNNDQIQDVNGPRFERILNANDSLFDPKSPNYVGQTIPYNPFNDYRVPIPTNLPLIKFATLYTKDLNSSKLTTFDLNIYTTDLFDLASGPVGLALGAFFSRETYFINPDDQSNAIHPSELGVGGISRVRAGRKEAAFYAETLIPIVSPEMKIWGMHSLSLDAGARFEDWKNNNTNVLVPKVELRWQPFDDQLTIRSTWGEGFLEPSMAELYGPTLFGSGAAVFTPTGENNPEWTIVELPNKHLAPEHDRTWTGGFVYTPKSIPPQYGSFTFSVDFWDIERTGLIGGVAPQVIINEFVAENPNFPILNPFSKIKVISSTFLPTKPEKAVLFNPQGDFVGVASPLLNGGKQDARGVDLDLLYQLQTPVGTLTSLTRTSYLEDFVFAFPGSKQAFHVAGRANDDWIEGSFFGNAVGGDGWMRWRGLESLDWTWKNWDLHWTVHYVGGYREEILAKQFDGLEKLHYVNATWFNDAQLSYSFIFTPPVEPQAVAGYSKTSGELAISKAGVATENTAAYSVPCWRNILNNTTITVGVNNIFGEDPPTVIGFEGGNTLGYPGFLYDNLGRFVYGKITKKF